MAQMTVFCGPMYSGKGKELTREYEQSQIQNRRGLVLKPSSDTRSGNFITVRRMIRGAIRSHKVCPCIRIRDEQHFHAIIRQNIFDDLFVDEAQFFPAGSPMDVIRGNAEYGWFAREVDGLLQKHRDENLRIFVAGLDLDYLRRPFGATPELCALADRVIKLTGICMRCRADGARFSTRIVQSDATILIGDRAEYEIRCRACQEITEPSAA